jgi:light-regulated signal transduction histidine kinase (bacteriophytochrome)
LAASIGLVLLLIFLVRIFISQRKELESTKQKLEKLNHNLSELVAQKTASLAKTNQELDTFLYRFSHNLRRPLTSLDELANVARLTLGEEGIRLFERVTGITSEMEKMINKLSMMNFIHQP